MDGFNPVVTGTVNAIVVQPDGRILIGGGFTGLQPRSQGTTLAANSLARLNRDGTVDQTFLQNIGAFQDPQNAGTGRVLPPQVDAIALQPDGRILVGGEVQEGSQKYLIRFNADGTLDTTFAPVLIGHIDSAVTAIQILTATSDPSGFEILIGGNFDSQNNQATVLRDHLALLHADGTLDTRFTETTNARINAFAVDKQGNLMLGGIFTQVGPQGTFGLGGNAANATIRNYFARLNPTPQGWQLDPNFDPEPNGSVNGIVVQLDQKVIIAGQFTQVWPPGAPLQTGTNYVARLNLDGTPDTTYAAQMSAPIHAIALLPNGEALLAGPYGLASTSANTGTSTATGAPVITSATTAVGTVGSAFSYSTTASNSPTGYGATNLPAGLSIDATTGVITGTPTSAGTSSVILTASNTTGSGQATLTITINGTASNLPVISSSGSAVATLGQAFSYSITASNTPTSYSTTALPAGLTLNATTGVISGTATVLGTYNITVTATNASGSGSANLTLIVANQSSVQTSSVVLLNASGDEDTTFNPAPNSDVYALAVEPDGSVLMGGTFTQVKDFTASTGVSRAGLARVSASGTLDTDFDPNAYGGIAAMAVDAKGDILIGGTFTSVNGQTVSNLARLSPNGTVDTSFASNPDGLVIAITVQPDGKILIGGTFAHVNTMVNGNVVQAQVPYLARLNTDGTVDAPVNADGTVTTAPGGAGFAPVPSGPVAAIALQGNSSNQILIGGNFFSLTPVNGPVQTTTTGTNTVNVGYLARLNSDGTVDTTFEPNINAAVSGIVVVPNSNWVVAVGSFQSVTPTSTGVSSNAPGIVRLGLDTGAYDPTFTPYLTNGGLPGTSITAPNPVGVNLIALQPDGKFVISGPFTQYTTVQSVGVSATTTGGLEYTNTPVTGLARLNSDGTLDPSFTPNPDGQIIALAVDSSSNVYLGGRFQNVGGGAQTYLARLTSNGAFDATFTPHLDKPATAILPLNNAQKQVLVGGAFTSITSATGTVTPEFHLARFNADGTADTTFQLSAPFGASIQSLALEPDGRMLVAGSFSNIGGTYATNIARFWGDGTADAFEGDANSTVYTMVPTADGSSVYVGGAFTAIGGITGDPYVARLNADGSADTTFHPPTLNGTVKAMVIDAQGRLILAGSFTQASYPSTDANGNPITVSVTASHLLRIDQKGNIDTGFSAGTNGDVTTLALQAPNAAVPATQSANGTAQIVIGGSFTTVDGAAEPYLARINDNGSLDASFAPAPGGSAGQVQVSAIAMYPDGSMLVGGTFATMGGSAQPYLAKVTAAGALDARLAAAPNGPVDAIALEDTGIAFANGSTVYTSWDNAIIGGSFTTVGGQARNNVARLAWTSGTALGVDPTYNPNADGAVTAVAVDLQGKTYLGGAFAHVGGIPRSGIARVTATGQATATLQLLPDRNTIVYTLSGEAPELSSVLFQVSPDLQNWTTIGAATQVTSPYSNTWKLTGVNGQLLSTFTYIRTLDAATNAGSVGVSSLSTVAAVYAAPSLVSSATATGVSGSYFYYRVGAIGAPTSYSATGLPGTLNIDSGTGSIAGSLVNVAAGTYPIQISMTNAAGTTTQTLTLVVQSAPTSTAGQGTRLVNVSTRGFVSPNAPLVDGFVIAGTSPKSVLLRGDGPTLGYFGVAGALDQPRLQLFDSSGRIVLTAGPWDVTSELMKTFAQVGAFPLGNGANQPTSDDAVVTTLQPGSYTIQISTISGNSGIAMAEVYDVDQVDVAPHFINVSGNTTVSAGQPAIAGFSVNGPSPKSFLIRGLGPVLAQLGVGNPLDAPVLTVYDSKGNVMASNSNWTVAPQASNGAVVRAATPADFSAVGARALSQPANSYGDAALVITLPDGTYTAQVTSGDGTTGIAVVEVYDQSP